MTEIQWRNPPAASRGRGAKARIDKVVSALKENPGRWALVAENCTTGSTPIYRKRGCEVTIRGTGEKSPSGQPLHDIYARWPEA